MSDIPPDELFACGCSIHCTTTTGTNNVTIIPCSRTCPLYLDFLRQARERGIPCVEYRIG